MELIISNSPAVSSLSKASCRSLSMSGKAIRFLNLLNTSRTISDFVFGKMLYVFHRPKLLTKDGFPVEATCPQIPLSNRNLGQPGPH